MGRARQIANPAASASHRLHGSTIEEWRTAGIAADRLEDYFGQNFRVVAFDRQGKLHDTAGRGGMSAGNIYQTRATFPKLQRDDIDHFEFQTRDYEYVTLRGLPIEPPENR